MQRHLSQLTFAPFQNSPDGPTLLTLHRYNQFADGARQLGLAANPNGRVVGIQSSKGVYISRTIVGYTWYLGPLLTPSPVHYGDSLADLERFLWDDLGRQGSGQATLPFLLGDEQGAIMALSLAAAAPDLLSGVIAVNAALPLVPGWEPPLSPLNGLPILLVNPVAGPAVDPRVLTGDALVERLTDWGGTVLVVAGADEQASAGAMSAWLAEQPIRRPMTIAAQE
jgi:pimeloyl-ACP methyl ester carboxylesterase